MVTVKYSEYEQNLQEPNQAPQAEVDMTKSAEPFSITSRPNNSLSPLVAIYVFSIITLIVMVIALRFTFIGAWPVLFYAFAVLIGLSAGFQYVFNHASDFEKITIRDGVVHLEIKELEELRAYEMNACWSKLITKYLPDGDCHHLALRSHGREIMIGRHLSAEKRNELADQLKNKLLQFK